MPKVDIFAKKLAKLTKSWQICQKVVKLNKKLLNLINSCQICQKVDIFDNFLYNTKNILKEANMQTEELLELVKNIKELKAEDNFIEIKSAHDGCPKKLYDTISAFSNQNGGGKIIFGISEKGDYEVVGVYNAKQLIEKVKNTCHNDMEPAVRGIFTDANIDGKIVVCLEIPGVDVLDRPVFYQGEGMANGSYIRIGDADMKMSQAEIYGYQAFKKRIKDDKRIVEDVNDKNIDENKINEYLKKVKSERPNLNANVSDDEILEVMGIKNNGKYTLTGVLIFAKYPQAYFPQFSITAVAINGYELGDTDDDGARFLDNKRITGNIEEMIKQAIDFVKKNSKVRIVINDDGKRSDRTEYPIKAIREAVLNSIVHRDYSIHTEGTPVSIEMYADRIEIKNPGGLYGNIGVEQLGKGRPDTRNEILANALEIMGVTENRYSGIPTINKELKNNGLDSAVYKSENGSFSITIYNSERSGSKSSKKIKGKSIEKALIEYLKIPRTRDEITSFTGLSKYYVINVIVKGLIDEGKVALTIPNMPRSSKQKYYAV